MTAFEDADLKRLAVLVQERRVELRLGIVPAANEAGMSKDTWKRVEAGLPVRATTYPGIEGALKWAAGSCRAILGGAAGPAGADTSSSGRTLHSELATQVADSVKLAAVAVSDSLTAAEIRDLSRRVIEELKQRGAI